MSKDLSGRKLGDYQLGNELGRGGMGTVYAADTLVDGPAGPAGCRVAIKVFHPELVEDERSLERFRREAEIGKRVRHPHVVRTFDVDATELDGAPVHFMVMEFIAGQTLDDLQAELGTVPEHLLFQISEQVLDALDEIHGQGVIHRDIKPENIVITPDHRVLLMDLGIARMTEGGHTLTEAGEFVGSLFYAAPEQFIGETVTGRCDIYAFGMVLYKLATGINPFETLDLSQMVAQKLQDEVKSPAEQSADVDGFWCEVITTCTRRETSERFRDAAELRAILRDGEESEWWRARVGERAVPTALPALKRLRLPRDVSLVGRDAELDRLRAAYADALREGRVLLLGGQSGVGKSRLVYEFVEGIAAAGGPVIAAGRSVGRGGRSFHPFVEAFTDLLGTTDRAALEQRLGELLTTTPGMISPLAGFLLGDVTGEGSAPAKDAILAACAEVLRNVSQESPVVMVIEDMQLAGPESIDLFAYLARCIAQHPVLLIGLLADDELEEGSDLAEWVAEQDVMTLEPLTPDATDELVGAVVLHPRTTSQLAFQLHRRSDGNPLIVLEMLSHLKETGALEAEGEGFRLVKALDDVDLPASMQELASLKLGRLDEDQREVLEAAAILGYVFEAPLLAEVLEIRKIKLLKRLAVLERKFRLLRSSGRDSFRFASQQMHEAVYESISPALRTEYHAVVADTIREGLEDAEPDGATAYALLRHLFLSEQALEAEPFLKPALRFMERQVNAFSATPFLEKLAEAFRIARPAARLLIAEKLWSAYAVQSRRDDELRVLEVARAIADEQDDPAARGRVLSCLAASHWLSGEMDKVDEEANEAIVLLRAAGDRNWTAKTLQTLGVLAYQRGDPKEATVHWEEAIAIRREIGDRKGEVSTLLALAAAMPKLGQLDKALETKQQALLIAREIGERRFEAGILNNIGQSLLVADRTDEAAEHYRRAVAIAREMGDQSIEAMALGNLGGTLADIGRVEEAKICIARAIEVARAINRPAREVSHLIRMASVLGRFGDRKQALEHLAAAVELAARIGDKPQLANAERKTGRFLHEWGSREDGWEHLGRAMAIDEEIDSAEGRSATLDYMGHAALNENRFDDAASLLERSLSDTPAGPAAATLLTRCRLASAYQGAGNEEKAREHATHAGELLETLERVSAEDAPEIHYRLAHLTDDAAQRALHLTTAEKLVATRARTIANGSYREHFLTCSGHNPEILEAARKAREG